METLTGQIKDRYFKKTPEHLKPLRSAVLGVVAGLEIWIPAFLISNLVTSQRISQLPETFLSKPLEIGYNFIDLIAYHPAETILSLTTTGTLISACKFLSHRK